MVSPFKKIDSDFISIMDGDDEGITLSIAHERQDKVTHCSMLLFTLWKFFCDFTALCFASVICNN